MSLINEKIRKWEIYIHTHTYIHMYMMKQYSTIKGNILIHATMVLNLENIILSEVNQTQNDEHSMIPLI